MSLEVEKMHHVIPPSCKYRKINIHIASLIKTTSNSPKLFQIKN